jgi:intein/homing endonuclease
MGEPNINLSYQNPFGDDALSEREIWKPEPELFEDPIVFADVDKRLPKFKNAVKPSEFTEFAFRMPKDDGQGYDNFSFGGRPHMRAIYDSPAKHILLICGRQVEKTLWVKSLVSLANGRLIFAEHVRIGDELATISAGGVHTTTGRVTWVSKFYDKPCIKITTRQGHVLTIALTHPMRLWGKWVEGAALKVGDRLAAVRKAGVFGKGGVSDERVRLTAYLLGDGHIGKKYIGFTSMPGAKLDEFLSDVGLSGGTYCVSKTKGQALQVRLHENGSVRAWMMVDGLVGRLSGNKYVPNWVFDLDQRQTSLFLNRLWSTDGHVKRNGLSKYSIEYCSISKILAQEVQALLWKFGIPSKIRKNWPSIYKRRGEKKLAYIVRVETQEGVRRFLTDVGALGKSEDVFASELVSNNNRDTFPEEVNDLVRQIIGSRGDEGRRGCQAESGKSLRTAGLRETLKYPPTMGKVQQYVAFFRSDERYDQQLVNQLEELLSTDLYWDEIVSIKDAGVQTCIDFEVAGTHNFVAEGLVTHNSTLLGNIALGYMCLVPAYKVLYVSPSATQSTTFSNDRIKEPVETSNVLKKFTTKMLSSNILEKQFINRSKLTIRYAFLNADRCRGIPAWLLEIDEFQDILSDNIPIIEQCLSHAPPIWKRYIYSGTPKSLDNNIEYYRARRSTQNEWVVPCDACGMKSTTEGAGRYWNVLGEKNIGKKGLVCEKCHTLINPMHVESCWARMVKFDQEKAYFESFRISQLMVPWKPWLEVLQQYDGYPRDKFYNEVLGISYDSGMRPLTMRQVFECCNPDLSMYDIEKYRPLSFGQPIFAGIDWGCHDEDTRILTKDGFKYFRDVTDEDEVMQWDPDTREMTLTKPMVRTVRDWDQPLLHFETKGGLDLMVTHTHRMRVIPPQGDKWTTEVSSETAERGNVKFVGYVDWKGRDITWFGLPGLPKSPGYSGCEPRQFNADDWIEFFGYMITEGGVCLKKNKAGELVPYCLKMSQRASVSPDRYQKIRDCMVRLDVPFSEFPNPKTGDVNWTICGKQYWDWFSKNMGMTGDVKRLPRWMLLLGKRQLRILFEAMLLGDGYIDPRDNCTGGAYYSTSKGLCEDFQEICIKLGLRCIVRLHKPASGMRKTRWRALWSAGRDYAFNMSNAKVKKVPYKGKVYCCAVPSGYIVTERNGCISYQGNTGENSYSVITLATYVDMKFRVFYVHRFVGEEVDPPIQLERIVELLKYFNVRVIGTDYGGGFDRNDHLVRVFGPERIVKYQYMARAKKKLEWDVRLRRWKTHRTEVMSDIFNAIKRKKCEFPKWNEFSDPYATDMLNIYSEYNESLRMVQYMHGQDKPDDAFHSLLYCWIASMLIIPRADIVAPMKEVDGRMVGTYQGPIDQG